LVIENKHWAEFESTNPVRAFVCAFTLNVSYAPISVRVRVLNDPPARPSRSARRSSRGSSRSYTRYGGAA
jgi:hypothetical protein